MRTSSPTPQCLQPVCHPSKFPPACRGYPRNNPGKTFFPNCTIRFSKTSFVWSLPTRQEILNVSQIAGTFHGICPPFFIDLIATILQRYLPLLCALLSQQSHLFLICVVSTYNESRKDLHKLGHIPRNCQCKLLLVSFSAPRTFASSFVFPEKLLFCTDTTGSVGWPNPAPHLHIVE